MIELFIAFAAGLISFLSPCVLPLIPGYISYISGSSLNELVNQKNVNLIPTFLFTVGFSIVFVIFGAASTFLGQVLLQNSNELRIFAGIVIIVLSLHIIGIINIKFLSFEKRIHTNSNNNFYSPILIGMAFVLKLTLLIACSSHINRVIIATKDRIEGRYLTSLTSMSPSLRTVEIIFNSSVSIAFKRIALYYCILFILAPHPANLFFKFSYPLSK